MWKAMMLGALLILAGCGGGSAESPPVVAFMGDSITQQWPLSNCVPNSINAGVGGNTTAQMMARFAVDVVEKKPALVAILGGTNDVSRLPVQDAENIRRMALLANVAGIRVILGTIPPFDPSDQDYGRFLDRAKAWNERIKEIGAEMRVPVADYYKAMLLPSGTQDTSLFKDPAHPNAAGYSVMCDVLRPLI